MHLIFGYLGFNNYGDEILASLLEARLAGQEVERLSRINSLWEHISKVAKAKEIIAIGGMFQDLSSPLSPIYYFLVILYAWLIDTRIVMCAQGIGPLQQPLTRFLTYIAFKMADRVSVRDEASSKLLRDLKIEHYCGSDLAWVYADAGSRLQAPEIEFANADKKYIAVSLKSYQTSGILIEDLLMDILADYDNPVMFLEMQDGDGKLHQKMAAKLQGREYIFVKAADYKPVELISILENYCQAMVSMRLHALILARIAGIELKAIVTDPKLDGLQLQINEYDLLELQDRAESCLYTGGYK